MITLYTDATPNGQKIHIMLEECGLSYEEVWVDIATGAQFEPAFLAISPNNKIPAIVDHDGPDGKGPDGKGGAGDFAVFESGAILIYLAEKTGRFLPTEPRARSVALQWLMFQMGGLGPMLGQAHHFRAYVSEKIPYAIDRYTNEASRLYNVLDKRLAGRTYLGEDYSIADMAVFPWIRLHGRQGQDLTDYPNLAAWFARIATRPAVAKDMTKTEDIVDEIDETMWDNLWGRRQFEKR